MRFQPLIIWWLIAPLALIGFGLLGWHIYRLRTGDKNELVTWIRRAGLFLLAVLLALGPSVPGGTSSPGVANLDVVIAVDTTASMGAKDYANDQLRLDGVKKDLLALAEKLQGAHFALITFDSKANLSLPSTPDKATFVSAVEALSLEIYGTSKGSAIDKPIDVSLQQLKKSKATDPDKSRLFFYLGDGEQTNDQKVGSFDSLKPYVEGGAVLGYGTAKGATMIRNTGLEQTGEPQYVNTIDPTTKKPVPAVSKRDEGALKKIASQVGVTYRDRNSGGSIDDVYRASNAEMLVDYSQKVTQYINLYWLIALPFAGLLFWEWKTVLLMLLDLRKKEGGKHA